MSDSANSTINFPILTQILSKKLFFTSFFPILEELFPYFFIKKTKSMKKIYSILTCAAALLAAWGCSEDNAGSEGNGAPKITAKLESAKDGKISFTVDASADAEVAYWFGESSFFETMTVTPEDIFRTGIAVTADSYPTTVEIEDVNLYIENEIWVAARRNDRYSEATCIEVNPSTDKILTAGESTKTKLCYNIGNVGSNTEVMHTYLELLYYKYLYEQAVLQFGEMTQDEFNQLALANYGFKSTGPRTIVWNAGAPNEPRESFAAIVGGRSYVALAATVIDAESGLMSKPEAIEIVTPEAGESTASVEVTIKNLTPEGMISVIDPGEEVRFFYYALFDKEMLDNFLAENSEKDLCDYLYVSGYISENIYTDQWEFTTPGVPYVLAIYGVDKNGDTFLQQELIEPEPYEPRIDLSLVPYDNEAENRFGYNTMHVTSTFSYFDQIDPSTVMYLFTKKEMIDAMLMELSIDEAMKAGIFLGNARPIPEKWGASLTSQRKFADILTEDIFTMEELQPETEYCFMVMTNDPSGTEVVGAYAMASTNKKPDEGEDEGYKAYLGEWTLKGQSTETWTPNSMTYNLRIEKHVANYSFKVYGWSDADVAQTAPFIMNYDPETQKIYVQGPQDLGAYNGNAENHLYFGGMILADGDNLRYVNSAPQRLFSGSISDNSLILIGELVEYEGRSTDFRSMNYVTIESSNPDKYTRIQGALYDAIYFNIQRTSGSTTARRNYVELPAPAPNTALPQMEGCRRNFDLYRMMPRERADFRIR